MSYFAFTYRLKPTPAQAVVLNNVVGCVRYSHNKVLADAKEDYQEYLEELESRLIWGEARTYKEAQAITSRKSVGRAALSQNLTRLKKEPEHQFLKEAFSQALQQGINDLAVAYKRFFDHQAGHPQFRKKFRDDSFRLPQGFEFDENACRVKLPKIGWVKYINSRPLLGSPKSITIKHLCDGWYIIALCEVEIAVPVELSDSADATGLDLGVVHFATLSNGCFVLDQEFEEVKLRLNKCADGIAKIQKSLARKKKEAKKRGVKKASNNYKNELKRLRRAYKHQSDIRHDFLHKASHYLAKNHGPIIVVEDLKIKNMTKSARGTTSKPGKNVKQKAGLNRAILMLGWGTFLRMLEYKLERKGGRLVRVSPKHTSQTCVKCGCVDAHNRPTQSKFKCVKCGYEANADVNAAQNILNKYLNKGRACPVGL